METDVLKQRVKSAAIVTMKNAPDMTRRGRKAVANWLRQNATYVEDYGDGLGKCFVTRYLYSDRVKKSC